jgi:hypothetical protein
MQFTHTDNWNSSCIFPSQIIDHSIILHLLPVIPFRLLLPVYRSFFYTPPNIHIITFSYQDSSNKQQIYGNFSLHKMQCISVLTNRSIDFKLGSMSTTKKTVRSIGRPSHGSPEGGAERIEQQTTRTKKVAHGGSGLPRRSHALKLDSHTGRRRGERRRWRESGGRLLGRNRRRSSWMRYKRSSPARIRTSRPPPRAAASSPPPVPPRTSSSRLVLPRVAAAD